MNNSPPAITSVCSTPDPNRRAADFHLHFLHGERDGLEGRSYESPAQVPTAPRLCQHALFLTENGFVSNILRTRQERHRWFIGRSGGETSGRALPGNAGFSPPSSWGGLEARVPRGCVPRRRRHERLPHKVIAIFPDFSSGPFDTARKGRAILPGRSRRLVFRIPACTLRNYVWKPRLWKGITYLNIPPGRHSRESGNPEDGYRLPQGYPPRRSGKSRGLGERCPLDSGFRRNDEGGPDGAGGRMGMTRKNRLQDRLVYNSPMEQNVEKIQHTSADGCCIHVAPGCGGIAFGDCRFSLRGNRPSTWFHLSTDRRLTNRDQDAAGAGCSCLSFPLQG